MTQDELIARARRFNLEKNNVLTLVWMSGARNHEATDIEAMLCDVCHAFLDDIVPEWRRCPQAADAVDPSATDTGKPSTRD